VRAFVQGFAAAGFSADALLAETGIDRSVLEDPDTRVPREKSRRLWEEAPRLSGDDALGMHAVERSDLLDGARENLVEESVVFDSENAYHYL
jgi:hypothetical protein